MGFLTYPPICIFLISLFKPRLHHQTQTLLLPTKIFRSSFFIPDLENVEVMRHKELTKLPSLKAISTRYTEVWVKAYTKTSQYNVLSRASKTWVEETSGSVMNCFDIILKTFLLNSAALLYYIHAKRMFIYQY